MPPKKIDYMKSFAFLLAVFFTNVLLINIGTYLSNVHKFSYMCSNRTIRFHGIGTDHTMPIDRIIIVKNARAWVSMDFK